MIAALRRSNNNMNTSILIGLYSLSVLACCLFGFWGLTIHYTDGFLTLPMLLAVISACICMALAVSIAKNNSTNYSILFLVAGIPLVFGFAIFFLPTCVPDEPTHINRLFDNRSGVEYTYVPTAILKRIEESWITSYKDMGELLCAPFNYSDLSPTNVNASSYSIINYIVPSTIVSIGRAIGLNAWLLVYCGRLANALMFLCCGAWALSRVPVGKAFLFVFLLNPMMIQQEASCSADALCNIAIIGFVSQTIAMYHSKEDRFYFREWFTLFFFLILLGLCKYAYLPIALIAVLLISKIKLTWLKYAIFAGLPICMILGIAYISAVGYLPSIINAASLLASPADFLELLGATIINATPILIRMYAGGQLGWPELGTVRGLFYIPIAWVATLALMLLGILASGNKESDSTFFITWTERIVLLFTSILSALVVFIGLAGPIRSVSETLRGYIDYMQGRYFFATGLLAGYSIIPHYAATSKLSALVSRMKPLHFFIGSGIIGAYTLLFAIFLFD